MGSSRLPGKTMADISKGMPLIDCVVRRFKSCKTLDQVVVATTTEPADDQIVNWCKENNVTVFRGSEHNVLERVIGAAEQSQADVIVQMGADSAYLDYNLIDDLVNKFYNNQCDYLCNDLTLTYPLGIYGHVVSTSKLREISNKADLTDKDRSDVVRYFWEHPDQYSIINVKAPVHLFDPTLRLTVDYQEDLLQARSVYEYFGSCYFLTEQIIELSKVRPELFAQTRNLKQASAPFLQKQF